MATYPVFVVNFTTHKDGDVVASADPNNLQAEVAAVETTLGAMPHVSTTNASSGVYANTAHTYASVAARLANIEQGIVSDAHSHYVHLSGGDIIAPAAGTVGLTIKAPLTPTTPIFQVTNNAGTPFLYVDSAMVARLAGGAAVVDATSAQTLTNKTLTTPVIAQIVNSGTLTLPTSTDTLVGRATSDTLTNKTLTAPTIGDHTNAGHSHSNAAGGGTLLQVNTHGSADTDAATTSLHHTIGAGAAQSAAGNHNHSGVYSVTGHTHVNADITNLSLANVSHADTAGAVAWGSVTSKPLNTIAGGQATVTFVGGLATFAHGMGVTPTGAVVQKTDGGSDGTVIGFNGPTAWDGTNLYLRCSTGTTGFAGGYTFGWIAFA